MITLEVPSLLHPFEGLGDGGTRYDESSFFEGLDCRVYVVLPDTGVMEPNARAG